MKHTHILIGAALIMNLTAAAVAAEPTQKKAGLSFRTDDNHPIKKWKELADIFEKYDAHFCASINFLSAKNNKSFLKFMKELQAKGHEIMDHSPTHSVIHMTFSTQKEAGAYAQKKGVHHVSGKKVCFNIIMPKDTSSFDSGDAIASKAQLKIDNPALEKKLKGNPFIFLEDTRELYLVRQAKDGSWQIQSPWGEKNVNFAQEKKINFRFIPKQTMTVEPEALRHQTRIVQEICKENGIKLPTTWIQPGGWQPTLQGKAIKDVMGDEFGYTAGATYPNRSIKCFNERNPDHDKAFGMQWGNFVEDGETLKTSKRKIADSLAKHYVLFGHSHARGSKSTGGWEGTKKNTEALLKWCKENDIPVRTHKEWAEILYKLPTNQSVNIMPQLNVDLDKNGIPDGFKLSRGVAAAKDDSETVLKAERAGSICVIDKLAGIEPGINHFDLMAKGTPGTELTVNFRFKGHKTIAVKGKLANSSWTKISGDVKAPESANYMTVDISSSKTSKPTLIKKLVFSR